MKLNTIIKMDTIFVNWENSKTSEPPLLILKLTDKLDLRRGEKINALSNLIIYYTWKNIKSSYNNNKFNVSASTWNDKFELSNSSSSPSDISGYFEHILKKHGENIDKPLIKIYVNNTENTITFTIKNGYIFELSPSETMILLGSTENRITKDKNGEKAPSLEITEVVLFHCNIVNMDYQQDSRVLYMFAPNKPFGSLLEISPGSHIILKTFNSEFQTIKVWFTDEKIQPLEIEKSI